MMAVLVLTPELEKIRSLARERVDQGGCRCSVADNVDISTL